MFLTHGYTRGGKTRIYRIWQNMHGRCRYPSSPSFHRYGGRGITICADWFTFEAFLDWASKDYASHLTLDRKDNDGPYDPDNCRWVTYAEQVRHLRTPVLRSDGVVFPSVSSAARAVGVKGSGISRALRYGTMSGGYTWGYV